MEFSFSSRAQFRLEGRDRVRFLHNVSTNDIKGLAPGSGGCLDAIVDRTGRLQAVFKVRAHPDWLFLDAPGALASRLREIVDKYAIMDDVRLVEAPGPVRGVFGPEPPDLPLYHWTVRGAATLVRVPFGYEIFGGEAGSPPAGDWQVFRIERGIPEWGSELAEEFLPVEVGLDSAVSYAKGCYLGQEVLLRLRNFSEPRQLLRGIYLDRPMPAGWIPEGRITSVSRSESRDIALAILRREHAAPGTRIGAGVVCALPFPHVKL